MLYKSYLSKLQNEKIIKCKKEIRVRLLQDNIIGEYGENKGYKNCNTANRGDKL